MRTIEEAYGLLFRERERWDTALGEFVATRTFQDLDSLRTSSHESLAGIALAVGFTDQAALSRSFKRLVGLSPGRWRRESSRRT